MVLKCGSLFQMREAAVGNARSPTVGSRVGGTISADVDAAPSTGRDSKSRQ